METIVLYDGAVTLQFDERQHEYWLGEEKIISPTPVLGTLAKPGLEIWKIKKGVEAFLDLCPPNTLIDEVNREEIADAILWAHRKKTALTIGKSVHLFAEAYAKFRNERGDKPAKPVNEEVWNAARAFLEWYRDRRVEVVSTEQILFSREHRYAGTADLLCRVDGEDTLWLLDYKTSTGVWPEYRMQVSAYTHCYEEEHGVRPRRGVILFPKDGGPPEHHDLDEKGTTHEQDLQAFLAAKQVYHWKEQQKTRRRR